MTSLGTIPDMDYSIDDLTGFDQFLSMLPNMTPPAGSLSTDILQDMPPDTSAQPRVSMDSRQGSTERRLQRNKLAQQRFRTRQKVSASTACTL